MTRAGAIWTLWASRFLGGLPFSFWEEKGGFVRSIVQRENSYVKADYVSMQTASATPGASASGQANPFQAVLSGDSPFWSVSEGRSLYLSELGQNLDGQTVTFPQYALVDMDADGAQEVAVKMVVDGNEYEYGYVVLDQRNGQTYGYEVPLRSMIDLKADGTLSYSNGASNAGFGRMMFFDDRYNILNLAFSVSNADGSVSYYSNDVPISQERFQELLGQQNSKTAVVWQ